MARELEERGYGDYRVSDAASMRMLMVGQLNIGRLAEALGVTRQAASKVARGLEERRLAVTRVDPDDARRIRVELTASGERYAQAIVDAIASLNRRLAEHVGSTDLAAADRVLRASLGDGPLRSAAERIPRPEERR